MKITYASKLNRVFLLVTFIDALLDVYETRNTLFLQGIYTFTKFLRRLEEKRMACTSKRNGLVHEIERLLQMAPGSGKNFLYVDNFHLILSKLLSYHKSMLKKSQIICVKIYKCPLMYGSIYEYIC